MRALFAGLVGLIVASPELALVDPKASLWATAQAAILVGVAGASFDIVIDAYRIELLSPRQLGVGAGMSQYGWRIGSVAAGALALVVAESAGWQWAYAVCAVFALPAMVTTLFMGEPARHREPGHRTGLGELWRSVSEPLIEFFARRGAVLVLLFVLLHKIGDTLANLTFRLLFDDLGYTNTEIAAYDVGMGFWAYLIGIFVGGAMYARMGVRRSVIWCLWLMAVSNLSFAGLAQIGHSNAFMAAAIGFENFASGAGGVCVVAYFSALCDLRFTASQYALISAGASVVGRFITGTSAGALIQSLGYVQFYLLTTLLALPGIVLFMLLVRRGYVNEADGEKPVDWGFAETLAYASILTSGNKVRITGQDVGRGTFSHRHAVLHDQENDAEYIPLRTFASDERSFCIYDSLLSEEAVLAFEYGYATTTPNALIIWEAQFGDFANSAQVVIDQFITSGENKWQRLCGLTMLLPHGYEGQGPEHSSARLERFLQLCAEHNIQVCLPTTSAQVFHMLRRQVLCPLRKPLVVMSPKSLLRHKESTSTLQELAEGTFQVVIGETDEINIEAVERVILCSGKVYYDLRQERRARGIDNIAIIRLEQLYPFPSDDLREAMSVFPNLNEVMWCQEEPMNQGAWYSSQHHMRRVAEEIKPGLPLNYAGREASASPAAGYPALHLEQLRKFLDQALTLTK